MSRPETKERRVLGPYADRDRWCIYVVEPDGTRHKQLYATEAKAIKAKAAIVIPDDSPTVFNAMREYATYLERKGLRPDSVRTAKFRINAFFGMDQPTGGCAYTTLAKLTPEQCKALYDVQTTKGAVDTHRNVLNVVKTFGRWWVKQGWVKTSPVEEIEPIGRRRRGKEQLRIDEARAFIMACERYAQEGDAGAISAMTLLLLGLRASEVSDRVVRDLDDGGRILWIPRSKTEAGKRTLEIPPSLQSHLKRLARGKAPNDRLFTTKDRQWVRHHVRRLCKAAGVPIITPHSLRGLHATLATEHGSTGRIVAAALGHTSFEGVTKRHYVAPGTTERVAQRRVGEVLAGGRDGEGAENEIGAPEGPVSAEKRVEKPFLKIVAAPTDPDPESRTAG